MRVTLNEHEVNMRAEDLPGFTYRIQDPIELGKFAGTKSTTFKITADNIGTTQLGGMAMSEVLGTNPTLRIGEAGQTYALAVVQPIEQDRDQVRLVAVGNNASWMKKFQTTKVSDLDLGRIADNESGGSFFDGFVVYDGSMNVPPTAVGTPYVLNGVSYDPTTSPLIGSPSWADEDSMAFFTIIDHGWDWAASVDVFAPLFFLTLTLPNTSGMMRPGLRAHRVLGRAFADLGYSLKINGRMNALWKKLILPCTVRTPIVTFSDDLKDLNRWADPMTVMDVLKGIIGAECLMVDTNDETKTVTLTYYDDFFKPHELAGNSLIGREDHTKPPIKQTAQLPKHINFKWQSDTDNDLKLINAVYPEVGYGNLIHNVLNGTLDDVNVELPFAPTALIDRAGLRIPGIRPATGVQYEWKPRLLVANGMTTAVYRQNGVLPSGSDTYAYPNVFFADPNSPSLSLPFEEQDHITPGTVAQFWTQRLRRYDDPRSLKIDLRLFDDELIDFDFGTPVLIHDGHEPGWYYFLSINQKRFGLDEPTECELIPE